MVKLRDRLKLTKSGAMLLAANAVPVIGVWLLDWNLFALVLVYWLENGVIGVFNVLKMITNQTREPGKLFQKLFMTPFFCVHYGGFWAGHGAFVLGMFRGFDKAMNNGPLPDFEWLGRIINEHNLGLAVLAIILSHGVSFVVNYIQKGEYKDKLMMELMFAPYGRVVVLHVFILGGAFLIQLLGAPKLAVVLLAVLKTAADLAAHNRAHNQEISKLKSKIKKFYEKKLDVRVEDTGPADLVEAGFVRDTLAEKAHNKNLKFGCMGAVALIVVGLVSGGVVGKVFGLVLVGVGLIAGIVSAVLINIHERKTCPSCGQAMEMIRRDKPLTSLSAMEKMIAHVGPEGQTWLKSDDDGTPTVMRLMQRWFVCHTCKTFLLGLGRDVERVAYGKDATDEAMADARPLVDDEDKP